MILITSGAYIEQELQANFGRIPPAFLPVRNKRLFYLQNLIIPSNEEKFISLPEDYEIDERDSNLLDELGFTVIKLPADLSLAKSIAYAISYIGKYDGVLRILHGDTLFAELPNTCNNLFSISEITYYYNWAQLNGGDCKRTTFSGYFSFADIPLLQRCLLEANYDFVNGIKLYANKTDVQLLELKRWYDFGHANTYFRSKSNLTTERVFNEISVSKQTFTKRSVQKTKIEAEAKWFEDLPVDLKLHTPHLLGKKVSNDYSEYTLEYLHHPTLNELYVFGNLPVFVWEKIIDDSFEFLGKLSETKQVGLEDYDFVSPLLLKTEERLKQMEKLGLNIKDENYYNGIKVPGLIDIANEVGLHLNSIEQFDCSIIHGDFCFSNVLYDFRSQLVKVIDPRGVDFNGVITNKGNVLYDLAKFAHSVIGLYDYIIAGYYNLKHEGNKFIFNISNPQSVESIQTIFLNKSLGNIPMNSPIIWGTTIHLFLSMLPLHSDNKERQMALLANALRLYVEFKNFKNEKYQYYHTNGWS